MTTTRTEWPSNPIPEPTKHLLGKFYSIGDDSSEDSGRRLGEEVFVPTGKIVVNKRTINGAAEISGSSHGIWQGIKTRQHEVFKVYSCNEAADDLILIGNVTWTFKDGQVIDGGFSARALIDTAHPEEPRLKLYQGWADLAEMQAALQQQH